MVFWLSFLHYNPNQQILNSILHLNYYINFNMKTKEFKARAAASKQRKEAWRLGLALPEKTDKVFEEGIIRHLNKDDPENPYKHKN